MKNLISKAFGSGQVDNKVSVSNEAVVYDRSELLNLIKGSLILKDDEKKDLMTLFNDEAEDVGGTGKLLISILKDEKESLANNKTGLKKAILKAQSNSKIH